MNLTSIKNFKNSLQALLVEGSFKRNLAITFSGHAVGQAIGFLFTPFIARAYGPESYGIFSLFMAITTNVSSVSTLQLPTGYVSARNHRELHVLLQITLACVIFTGGVSALVIGFFKDSLLRALDAANLAFLVYLIPVYVVFMGIDYMLLGWNIYLKEFGRGAIAKISSVVISKGGTLLCGMFVTSSALGLILGNLLIYPLESTIKLSKKVRGDFASIFRLGNWTELKNVSRRFKSYPLFVTPGLLVTGFNGQLPVYLFSMYFDSVFVGLFALASSLVTVPLSVITNPTTTVFLQKAAETARANPNFLKDLVLTLHRQLFLICFIPLSVFAFFSDWIFVVIFGTAWQEAGWISSFLAVGAILSVPHQPLSVLFRLLNKEHNNLLLGVTSIALRLIGLGIGIYHRNVKIAVAGYTAASILTTAFSLGLIFSMVKLKVSALNWYVLAVLAIFILLILEKF